MQIFTVLVLWNDAMAQGISVLDSMNFCYSSWNPIGILSVLLYRCAEIPWESLSPCAEIPWESLSPCAEIPWESLSHYAEIPWESLSPCAAKPIVGEITFEQQKAQGFTLVWFHNCDAHTPIPCRLIYSGQYSGFHLSNLGGNAV